MKAIDQSLMNKPMFYLFRYEIYWGMPKKMRDAGLVGRTVNVDILAFKRHPTYRVLTQRRRQGPPLSEGP